MANLLLVDESLPTMPCENNFLLKPLGKGWAVCLNGKKHNMDLRESCCYILHHL
jgi:hypothetical protein